MNSLSVNFAGRPFENFLSAMSNPENSALSRTLCLEAMGRQFFFHAADEIILQSNSCVCSLIVFFWKTSLAVRDKDTDIGRRGKRVSLNVLDMKNVTLEIIAAFQ